MTTAKDIQASINKRLGDGVVKMGSDPHFEITNIPTGVLPFDSLIGGGVPRGRFVEIFGGYSTLKSFVGYHLIVQAQQRDGLALLVDTERAADEAWLRSLGVDVDKLMILQPKNGETAVDAVDVALRSGIDAFVWDSIAATLPRNEERFQMSGDKEMQPARLAALMSAMMRKLNTANSGNTAGLFINQTRENVGVMYGSPETTPGGKAMGFYASHRISLRKSRSDREKRRIYGTDGKADKESVIIDQMVTAKLEKSRLTSPGHSLTFGFNTETGQIDTPGFMLAMGLTHGLITRSGNANWIFNGEKAVTGIDKFKSVIAADPNMQSMIKAATLGEEIPNRKVPGRKITVKKKIAKRTRR
jgi:recombination protein RecA